VCSCNPVRSPKTPFRDLVQQLQGLDMDEVRAEMEAKEAEANKDD